MCPPPLYKFGFVCEGTWTLSGARARVEGSLFLLGVRCDSPWSFSTHAPFPDNPASNIVCNIFIFYTDLYNVPAINQ